MPIGRGTALLPRRAATTAHASRSCHRRQKVLAAVCAMRVLRQRANGAARCNAVALVLMQAGHASQSVLPPKRLRRVCVMRVLRQQQLLLHPTECGPSASCSCELVDASW